MRTFSDSPWKRTLPLLSPPLRAMYRLPRRSLEGPVLPSARSENAGGLNLTFPTKNFAHHRLRRILGDEKRVRDCPQIRVWGQGKIKFRAGRLPQALHSISTAQFSRMSKG